MNKVRPEVTNRRIESFSKRFGKAHLYLAYHAAFPLALTPDLLYRLWANFQQDIYGEMLGIPWVAVADLLLSNLCDEVGHELYEIDLAVRNELLNRLKEDEKFGQQRIQELSNFMLYYVQQQLQSDDLDIRDFAQTQRWTALAYIQPSQVAKEIALEFTKLEEKDTAELVRMASLTETFTEHLAGFKPLLIYVDGIKKFVRGDIDAAKTQFSAAMAGGNQIQVADVILPIPEQLQDLYKNKNSLTQTLLLKLKWLKSLIYQRWESPPIEFQIPTIYQLIWVAISSLNVTFLVVFLRFFGALEPSELWLFDNMMRLKRPEEPDKNILIIQVTPEDIRNQGSEPRQGSLTDTTLFKILDKLLQNSDKIRPKAIGFDIHRDFETKNADLSKLLKDNKNNPIFAVCYVGDETQQNTHGVKPPPEFINKRIGFSDFLPDKNGIVRRHTLIMDSSLNSSLCRFNSDKEPIKNAFSLEIARHFLDQSEQPLLKNGNSLEIGNTRFESIYGDYRGGYSMFTEFNGYQILLNYRISCINGATCSPENIATKVTVADVLKPDFLQKYKDFVKDKIVLIGVTDPTYGAPWTTPLYSESDRQIPGVIIQAQMISQLINAVLEKRPLLQVWSIWFEMLWILVWSLVGGTTTQLYRSTRVLIIFGVITIICLYFFCFILFIVPMVWIPFVPAVLAFIGTSGVVVYEK